MEIDVFLLSILASIIGTIIYVSLLSRFEGTIRAWLKSRREGSQRRKYVETFISAVKGETKIKNVLNIACLLMLYPVIIISLMYSNVTDVNSIIRDIDQNLQKAADLRLMIDNQNQESEDTLITLKNDMNTLKNDMNTLENEMNTLENDINKDRNRAEELRLVAFVGVAMPVLWVLYLLVFWLPTVVFRARFETELERFMSRIHLLASKSELAEIARLEHRVDNEESAELFVTQLGAVAERHDVRELVDSFRLWDISITNQ